MKQLNEYDVLTKSVFYRGWHILEYIEKHELSSLDIEALKATIMDALVFHQAIDPDKEYLNFNDLSITSEKEGNYAYEKYPNVSGIPLWMKELFRTKCVKISGSVPVSMFLTIPNKERCVYDLNTAVSTCFDDWTFYLVNYKSPTRLGEIAKERPFIEVNIDGIPYLIDNLTRRIFRRDFFERNYGFDIIDQTTKYDFDDEMKEHYKEDSSTITLMGPYLAVYFLFYPYHQGKGECAEHHFEVEQSKEHFKEGWIDYADYQEGFKAFQKTLHARYQK